MEVKYIDDKSLLISSVIGIHPSSNDPEGWPFLNNVIGSPFLPTLDQLFKASDPEAFAVLPNRILLPHLPWYILSPEKGCKGWIFSLSKKVFWFKFKSLSNISLSSS